MQNFARPGRSTPKLRALGICLAAIGATALLASAPVRAAAADAAPKPTIVLVHGAFAGSSSWDGVTARLVKQGFRVIAAANPLRGVASDGAYVRDIVKGINGPTVLVGHSYGGAVITSAADGAPQVKALVYVAAFAPDSGETAVGLSGKFAGSTLGPTLAAPVALSTGGKDLYIDQARFHAQFAADVPATKALLMAAEQRPITEAALNEAAGVPTWKQIPSWFIYGSADKNIPAQAQAFMAERASSKKTVVIAGASHVVMVSNPDAVARLIGEAARATATAGAD